jgi:hypothetical protein
MNMARAGWKDVEVKFGIPGASWVKLGKLASDVGTAIGKPKTSEGQIAAWALHYILSLKDAQAIEVVQIGRAEEAKYAPKKSKSAPR